MEPILSKQEIADLLQTLQTDGAKIARGGTSTPPSTDSYHTEISLFEPPAGKQQRAEIPNFNLIIDQFQAIFGRSMSQYLQKTVTLEALAPQTITFKEYLTANLTHRPMALINLKPLNHGCLLSYESQLWFLLLEIILGGDDISAMKVVERSPTRLELNLLKSTIDIGCRALDRAFLPVMQINSSLIKTAHEPAKLSFTSPDAVVLIYRFEVRIEDASGIFELVFVLDSLAPISVPLQKLSRLNGVDDQNWADLITGNLDSMPFTIMARSCLIDLSIRELIGLKVGDVIPVSHQPDSSVDVLVEGVTKFSGTTGQKDHKKNVMITKTSP